MRAVVLGHGAFTLAMVGLMCAVQFVVYPQFRSVDPADFTTYAADHSTRIVEIAEPTSGERTGWRIQNSAFPTDKFFVA